MLLVIVKQMTMIAMLKLSRFLSEQFAGIRAKLIAIFVLIKVVPLFLLALIAWKATENLGASVLQRSTGMADQMLATIRSVGDKVTEDAARALDDRGRESLERVTTDSARAVAAFLYDRDQDIRQAVDIEPGVAAYRAFLAHRQRQLFAHGPWKLAADGKHWEPVDAEGVNPSLAADAKAALRDNTRDFSTRPPEYLGRRELRPLYVEMSFVGLDGREKIKATTGSLTAPGLADVRERRQTFAKAEDYWRELRKLKAGELYVSEVIGSYVGSRVIGPYLPETAKKAGIAFTPEQSAYAGTENPLGRRFRGIVRWAAPVERNGVRIGYVTLALDHDHIRQFTDRIAPTAQRYTPISDAIVGNYAFMWDYKGRAISHPRDYFIPGYNDSTGLPETPWLDQSLYAAWQASGKPSHEFLAGTTAYLEQSLKKKPAAELVKAGTVGLDCRYLNFSPQCQGWNQLTEHGGSGSFAIFFGGLWKLTTAATIPYYTGQYGRSPRGFGFVTIGANVDDFHQAAIRSKEKISGIIEQKDGEFKQERSSLIKAIDDTLAHTTWQLLISTTLMMLIVIGIAIKIAGILTRRITVIVEGIRRFQEGDHGSRLAVRTHDEMGELAASFNRMADAVQVSFAGMSRELQTRRLAEEQLRIAATSFEAQEGMTITDASGVILRVNRAFVEITGYGADEAIGRNPRILRSGRHDAGFYTAMWAGIAGTGSWQGEIWNKRKNGEVYPSWLSITAVKGEDGAVTHYVGSFTDITTRKTAEEEIAHLAFYDQLTKLPNRRLMLDRLGQALTSSMRHARHGALMLIDLDHFKTLNDTLGHAVGDQLLVGAASRLVSCIREGDTVARLGGDEFVVILEALSEDEQAAVQAESVAEKIQTTLADPYLLDVALEGTERISRSYLCTASIGITLFRDHSVTADELMKRADTAMYQAKAAGRNTLRFFDPEMQSVIQARAALEVDLHEALAQQQFLLYYQAQVDAVGRVTGAEALVRWQHPVRGLVSPMEFIPLAEETGLILPIGYWVLKTACSHLAAWAGQAEMSQLTVAVNVSARQFHDSNFLDMVQLVLEQTGANPGRLKLELTESLLVENVTATIEKMSALKSKGVGFSLDDFGTGYSSLSYLKRLPLDQLKIDQSFVRDILTDPNDASIAKTIVALAQSLGLEVIAEGVETAAQRDFLGSSGCHAYQGYFFSRPLPLEEFEAFVKRSL